MTAAPANDEEHQDLVAAGLDAIDRLSAAHELDRRHPDHADDIRQYLAEWIIGKAIHQFNGVGDFGAYVFHFGRWRIVDALRTVKHNTRTARQFPLSLDAPLASLEGDDDLDYHHLAPSEADTAEAGVAAATLSLIAERLDRLTPLQRDALIRPILGDRLQDVADDYNCHESWVCLQRQAARRIITAP